jgi:aspartate 1-decarboxylase
MASPFRLLFMALNKRFPRAILDEVPPLDAGKGTAGWGNSSKCDLTEGERVQRFMLRSKIHRATLTGTDLDYEGSIAIDRDLIEAAGLLPGEQVHVLNLHNGQRLITYVIEAPAGSGTMLLNGPAARLGERGDRVVILAYGVVSDEEAKLLRPIVVHVDGQNHQVQR